MSGVRETFLEAVEAMGPVVTSPNVAARWDEPSVLRELTVRGLAGHLVRSAAVVIDYLGRPAPTGEQPINAEAYYPALVSPDINKPSSVEVRRRGEAFAAGGPEALIDRYEETRLALPLALDAEPADRLLRVAGDLVMRLDDNLVTRIVEALVHIDDLALSVGLPAASLPAAPLALAIPYLVEVARYAHGDLAVLRALTRRERDEVEALRVF